MAPQDVRTKSRRQRLLDKYSPPIITSEPNPVLKRRIKQLIKRWIQARFVRRDISAKVRAVSFEKLIFPRENTSKPRELIEIVQIVMRELGFPQSQYSSARYYVGCRLEIPPAYQSLVDEK